MKILYSIFLIVSLWPIGVLAHSGGTDSSGCHTNRKTGDYHCHAKKRSAPSRSTYEPEATYSSSPTKQRTREVKKSYSETDYQKYWCNRNNGEIGVSLSDGSRVDCVTETHAVEIGLGRNWAKNIGLALYSSTQTDKSAGIVLILQSPLDWKYLKRMKEAIEYHELPITVWQIKTIDLK